VDEVGNRPNPLTESRLTWPTDLRKKAPRASPGARAVCSALLAHPRPGDVRDARSACRRASCSYETSQLAGTASLRGYQSESLCRMRLR
jgi:hypothetical protein